MTANSDWRIRALRDNPRAAAAESSAARNSGSIRTAVTSPATSRTVVRPVGGLVLEFRALSRC